jgi:hypothetical protein
MPTPYALPNIPDNCCLFKIFYEKTHNDSRLCLTFAFQADVVPLTFDMQLAVFNDIKTWGVDALKQIGSSDNPPVTGWLFYRYAGITHSWPPNFGILGWNPFPYSGPNHLCLSPRLCACFRRETGLPGKNNIGRFYSPGLPQQYVNGNRISATGDTFLQAAAIAQMRPWTSQGVTFTPALWSQQLGTITPLTNVILLDNPRTLYKRREILPYLRQPMFWPIVP